MKVFSIVATLITVTLLALFVVTTYKADHKVQDARHSFAGESQNYLKGYRLDLPEDMSTTDVFPEPPDTLIAIIVGDVIHIRFKTDLHTIQIPPGDSYDDEDYPKATDFRYAYLHPIYKPVYHEH